MFPPPTCHASVEDVPHCWLPPDGAFTTNGAPATVTVICEKSVPPPLARLSRVVTRKFMGRSTLGSVSQLLVPVPRTFCICGKVREAEAVGLKDRKTGPAVAAADGKPAV